MHICIVCVGQEITPDNKIIFNAYFDKDTVFVGDSVKITLCYKNNSQNIIQLYPQAEIGIVHNHEYFIFVDTDKRIAYMLNNFSNPNNIVEIESEKEFQDTFNILVNKSFFYEDENTVVVLYRFWEKNNTKRKQYKRKPQLALCSPPIKIIVVDKEPNLNP